MAKAPQTKFGRWTFNPTNGCLEIDLPSKYEVPIKNFTTSAEILDWIFQVSEKTWATAKDVGDLVRAAEHIFGRGVAGGGGDHPIDAKGILTQKYGCKFP
jgi:hypothetical protein